MAAIAQTIATKFFLAGVNVGTGIITARALGTSGRGEQSAMLLWPALLTYLLTLGIPTALRYCIRREPARRAELYTIAVMVGIVMSGVAMVIGLALIPVWLRAYSSDVIRGAQILLIFAPEVMLGLVLTAMLETLGDFKLANTTRYIPTVITLFALAWMAATHTLTPFNSAVAYLLPPVLTAVWMAWKLRSHFTSRLFDPRPGLRALGSYGLRAYGIDILATLSVQIDQVLVIGILNATQMGIYVVALNASRVVQLIHSAVATVTFPSAAGLEKEQVVAMVGRATRASTFVALIFALALIAALPILIPLFYGKEFIDAVSVAQLLTVEALLGGLAYVLSQTFMALGRPGYVTLLHGIGIGIALPGLLLLIPRMGLIGAAVALLLSTTLRLAVIFISYPVVLKIPIPSLLPNADDVRSFQRALSTSGHA
jgi:O-antigen/teichoic acid export membrane protein